MGLLVGVGEATDKAGDRHAGHKAVAKPGWQKACRLMRRVVGNWQTGKLGNGCDEMDCLLRGEPKHG